VASVTAEPARSRVGDWKELFMSLGTGIVLFVIGAILAFALNVQVSWINLDLVGYILMAAGVVMVILGIIFIARRRNSVTTARAGVDPVTGDRVERQVTSTDDPVV
jgi:sulfite exporter TauE/SafE